MDWKPIIITVFAAFIGAVGQIEIKKGSSQMSLNLNELLSNTHLIIGVSLYALCTLIYVYALSFGEVSVLYPILATSYIWVGLLASVFLGERFVPINWAGMLLIIVGITLTAWQ
ncbi:MAG: EamA family transporter [Candidatus Bathyarchaeota archaeon]|nr:EamA family transporter [Candidatus Bathyarchaeota archaeon]